MSKKRRKTSGKVSKSRNNETARTARQAFSNGNYDKVIITLNTTKARKFIPDDRRMAALAEAHFRRAMRYRSRQPSDALRDLLKAVEQQPNEARYHYHLGLLHHQQGDYSAAVAAYRAAQAQNPDFDRAAVPLLFARRADGATVTELQADVAWASLSDEQRALLSGNASKDVGGLPAALMAMERGAIEEAEAQFAETLKGKRVPSGHKAVSHDYLGRIAARRDDLPAAMGHWRKAYRLGYRDPVFLGNLALLHVLQAEAHIEAGDHQAAFELAEQANTYHLDHPRLPDIQAHTALALGYRAAQAGDWLTALDYWRKPQAASGATARALAANLGLAYEALESYGHAADAWRDFVKRRGRKEGSDDYLTPEQTGRLWSRVSGLYAQAGDGDEAVNTLKTALKHDPDNIEMNLQLARHLAEVGSIAAAHNQVDNTLKMDPNRIETLVLRAELWELAAPTPHNIWGGGAGIDQWHAVLNAGDDAYASLAKQRLQALYSEQVRTVARFNAKRALEIATKAVEDFPDFHIVRANLIRLLYHHKDSAAIWEQIDKLDLTNEHALHHLIDTAHIYKEDADAAAILARAEAQKTLPGDFYKGIARCAMDRKQIDIATGYYQVAIDRAEDDTARNHIRVDMAHEYYSSGMFDEAKSILNHVLEINRRFGPAHMGMAAIIHAEGGNKTDTKRHLRKARSWAKQHNDEDLLYEIETLTYHIDNPMPLGGLLGGLDPSMLPPDLQRVVEGMSPAQLAALLDGMLYDMDDEDDF